MVERACETCKWKRGREPFSSKCAYLGLYCSEARLTDTLCGAEGKFWTKKEPSFFTKILQFKLLRLIMKVVAIFVVAWFLCATFIIVTLAQCSECSAAIVGISIIKPWVIFEVSAKIFWGLITLGHV